MSSCHRRPPTGTTKRKYHTASTLPSYQCNQTHSHPTQGSTQASLLNRPAMRPKDSNLSRLSGLSWK